ncbi:penicillin-binding protein activator LpoB [Candidimonas sp. SYP-B2681]|uniref:penicillin-binding protein activator LpoB n=1 Tax=Candidimonas sp. SYP-B2681 TaxID=2497686 RepID=UPI000F89A378|nr:penicillin-binding protein activator LpoB [Candidimonas sp. SYP-B2681]RTZ47694.1 penicillin-binding protein activator LpoB [Candidimonas sp. SYP-B2681]
MTIMKQNRFVIWAGVLSLAMLGSCSTTDVGHAPALSKDERLVMLPIANQTETPGAGERAQSIAQSILLQQGLEGVQRYPADHVGDAVMGYSPTQTRSEALEWARGTGAAYALTGSVQEWRYKVGVDGEPVVGLTFDLIDLGSGATVWSATGSRSGWSRSSVTGVGHALMRELLAPLALR